MEAEEGTNEERNGFGRRKEEKQRSVKITKEKTPRRRMFFLSIARFVLSQARRGFLLHFFVWADEIVAYLSQSSATAPDLLPSVSFQRTDLKECGSGGETGNFTAIGM